MVSGAAKALAQIFPTLPMLPLKVILLIIAGLITMLIAVMGIFELRKGYWDRKIDELCAIDGGDKLYRQVQATEKELPLYLNQFGQVDIPSVDRAPANVKIVHKWVSTPIHANNPEVRRDELLIYSRPDGEKLATRTSYSRVGGELFALHPSHHICPDNSSDIFAAVIKK